MKVIPSKKAYQWLSVHWKPTIGLIFIILVDSILAAFNYRGFVNYVIGSIITIVAFICAVYEKQSWDAKILLPTILALVTALGPALLTKGEYEIDRSKFGIQHPVQLEFANSQYNSGLKFLENGEFEKAIERFDKALEKHENSNHAGIDTIRIFYAKGMTYDYKGDPNRAIECYTDALGVFDTIEMNPQVEYEKGYVEFLLASTYCFNEEYEKADIELSKSIDALEKFGNTYLYDMSSIYLVKGDIQIGIFDKDMYVENLLNGQESDISQLLTAYLIYTRGIAEKGDITNEGIEAVGYYLASNYSQRSILDDESITMLKNPKWKLTRIDRTAALLFIARASSAWYIGEYEGAMKDLAAALHIYNEIEPSVYNEVDRVLSGIAAVMLLSRDTVDNDGYQECLDLTLEGLAYCLKWKRNSSSTVMAYYLVSFAYALNAEYDEAMIMLNNARSMSNELDIDLNEIFDLIQERYEEAKVTGHLNLSIIIAP